MPHQAFHSPKSSPNLLKKEGSVKPKKLLFWLLFFLVFIIIIYTSVIFYQASQLFTQSLAGKEALEKSVNLLKQQEYTSAQQAFQQGQQHFQKASRAYSYMRVVEWIPAYTHEFRFVGALLSVGDKGSKIMSDVLLLLAQQQEVSFQDLSEEKKKQILQYVSDASNDLHKLGEGLQNVIHEAELLKEETISAPLKPVYDRIMPQLEELQPLLEIAAPAMQILPDLAGYPEEKTFLLLLQNNHELRPTGGFIGTYGILKVKNGEIDTFFTDNIYNIDNLVQGTNFHVDPPWQLTKYMKVKDWLMRDANWDPNVPTAAQQVIWFYNQEGGTENIDAVIGLTPTFIERLLDIVGPVVVQGHAYTSENLVEVLQFKVEKEYYVQGISDAERKEIINVLAQTLKEKLFDLNVSEMALLLRALQSSLEEKHLWVYDKDPDIQDLIERFNWAGEIHQTNGDYLMVVDSNLAALKTDAVLDRSIDYRISQNAQGEFIATASISYDNYGTFTWKTTRYRTYTRVYVPKGSKLIDVQGAMEMDRSEKEGEVEVIEDEHGKTRFGAFISIEPGKKGTLSFTYVLPSFIQEQIRKDQYELIIQKQPGTKAHTLTLDLNFGKNLLSASPTELPIHFQDQAYTLETDLRTDRDFFVQF